MADQDGKNQRHAAKGQFTRKFTELTKSVEEDKGSEILRVNFKELNKAWRNVEAKHVMYTTFLKDSETQRKQFLEGCWRTPLHCRKRAKPRGMYLLLSGKFSKC